MYNRQLILEDGTVYKGYAFGADVENVGEVVFNTSMTGYQEILSDPSYNGQIVTLTYPLVGNYGINRDDFESMKPCIKGMIVKEVCTTPNHHMLAINKNLGFRRAAALGMFQAVREPVESAAQSGQT